MTTPVSLKKQLSLYAIMLVSVVLAIELLAFAAFFVVEKRSFSFSRIYSERTGQSYNTDALHSARDGSTVTSGQIIHPYLGYVYSPEYRIEADSKIPISEYGFVDINQDQFTPDPGTK